MEEWQSRRQVGAKGEVERLGMEFGSMKVLERYLHVSSAYSLTDDVVVASASNWRSGKDILAMLLKNCGEEVQLTEGVPEAITERFHFLVTPMLHGKLRDGDWSIF